MQFADETFDTLGFTEEEKHDVYKNIAGMMHIGNMTKHFVSICKEEQAGIKKEDNSEKVLTRLHINEIASLTYEITFRIIVEKCNEILAESIMKKINSINMNISRGTIYVWISFCKSQVTYNVDYCSIATLILEDMKIVFIVQRIIRVKYSLSVYIPMPIKRNLQ